MDTKPRQLSLFECENKGLARVSGVHSVIRAAMNRTAAASAMSREQIVARMNSIASLAGKKLTQGNAKALHLDTLEKWLNPESEHMPSFYAVGVFMEATGDIAPLTAWLELHGLEVMTDEARILRDLGASKLALQRATEHARNTERRAKEAMK